MQFKLSFATALDTVKYVSKSIIKIAVLVIGKLHSFELRTVFPLCYSQVRQTTSLYQTVVSFLGLLKNPLCIFYHVVNDSIPF